MRQLFNRLGAFLLAALILVATSSFTLNMHYCGSKLISYNALGNAKPCCKLKALQFSEDADIGSPIKTCCKNKELEKESEDELTHTIVKTEIEFHQFLLRLPQLLDSEFSVKSTYLCEANNRFKEGHSLHCYRDRQALFQVYLI